MNHKFVSFTVTASFLLFILSLGIGCATQPARTMVGHPVPAICPLQGPRTISSAFDGRNSGHAGVDLPAPKGTPVLATADGTVIFSGRMHGYGRLIRVAHANGIETWYAHLKSRKVKAGRTVLMGQRIGTVGNSGRSHGPHLHYEIHVNGRPVDPAKYFLIGY